MAEYEKTGAQHVSDVHTAERGGLTGIDEITMHEHRANDDRAVEAMGKSADKFDKSYWYSKNFLGTLFAIGMAFMGGIGGFGLIAPVLGEINADIGPSPNINVRFRVGGR